MKIQSILVPNIYHLKDATEWVMMHKYNYEKVHRTNNYWRYRQYPPTPGAKYISKTLSNGVILVFEK